MLQTTVLLSDHAAGCFCLHCQSPIPPATPSELCVNCYLDAVSDRAGHWDLPVALDDGGSDCIDCGARVPDFRGKGLCPDCVRAEARRIDDRLQELYALGVPCPGDDYVPF